MAAAVNPNKNIAYAPMRNVDSLLAVDFRTADIKTFTVALRRMSTGSPVRGVTAGVSIDGKWLIIDVGIDGVTFLQIRDAETLELKYEFTPGRPYPVFHPDGNRIFFCQWFDIFEGTGQGALWVLNLKTLLMTRVLTSDDVAGAYPYIEGLDLKQVEITPDGKYALLLSSNGFIADGPIIKLDLDNYQIVDAFYPRWPAYAKKLRIYPIEIK